MTSSAQRFEDFHLYGASAPEWNQRYHQISRGTMSSSLLEASFGRCHVFRKTLDQRVVQQGCLPRGQICFAMPAAMTAPARMQGREVSGSTLFVLREGDEFTLHRPAGMALFAVTFDRSRFDEFIDAAGRLSHLRPLLAHPVLELPADALARCRAVMEEALAASFDDGTQGVRGSDSTQGVRGSDSTQGVRGSDSTQGVHGSSATLRELTLLAALSALLAELPAAARPPRASSASFVVEAGHRLALSAGSAPVSIEDVCKQLRASRRTVQNSFQSVAQTTPLNYLRSIRLNAVRRQLLSTRDAQAGVGEVAADWGFAHLGHFAAQYKRLFGESPSATPRRSTRPANKLASTAAMKPTTQISEQAQTK
jgi:AraC-like DNA-binding protein